MAKLLVVVFVVAALVAICSANPEPQDSTYYSDSYSQYANAQGGNVVAKGGNAQSNAAGGDNVVQNGKIDQSSMNTGRK